MIRSYVSRLRRVLPDNVIESVGGGYALRTGTVDLTGFGDHIDAARSATDPHTRTSHLRAALELWRGTSRPGQGVRRGRR